MSTRTSKSAKARRLALRTWIAGAPALGAFVAMLGCSGSAPIANERSEDTSQAIYGGTVDNDANANQGVVSLKIGDGASQFELCSGSLISPNMVLTARHCVSVNLTQGVACDENGVSGNGNQVGADDSAASIHIFTGANPNLLGTPVANGKAIFHSQSDVLCNNDLAILVLDRPVTGITPLKVRLNKPVASGEQLRSVGYGQNDQKLPVGTRLRKDNVGVLAVGKIVSTNQTPLATNEFEVGLSICQGDSGGPAISESSGAVVGIVSRGGSCTDTFGHIYTSLGGFKAIFDQAAAAAATMYTEESATTPPPQSSGGSGGSSGGSSGGAASGGASGGSPNSDQGGTTQSPRTVNLRSGAGNNCSASGAPNEAQTAAGGVALGAAIAALAFLARRRRVVTQLSESGHATDQERP